MRFHNTEMMLKRVDNNITLCYLPNAIRHAIARSLSEIDIVAFMTD